MSHAKTIFSNLVSLSIGEFLGKGLMFFVTIYLARILEPEAFGQYSFVVAFVSFFYITSQMGLDAFGSREIAKFKEKAVYYLNAVMSLKLVMSIINYAILVIIVLFLQLDPIISKMLLIFGVSIFANALLTEFYFSGLEKMKPNAIGKIIRPIVFASLVFIFIHSKTDLIWVPVYYVVGTFVTMIYLVIAAYKENKFEFNLKPAKNFLGVSFVLGLSGLLGMINFQIDKLIIPIFDTFENLGLYESGVRLISLVFILLTILWSVFMPRITKLINEKKDFSKYYSFYFKLMLFVGFIFAGLFLTYPKIILNLFYSSEYILASEILFLFGFAVIIYTLSTIFLNLLFSFHKEKIQLKIIFITSIINIVLNFIFIPLFGILGAAITTIISTTITGLLAFYYVRKNILFDWKTFLRFFIVFGITVIINYYLVPNYNWIINLTGFSILFIILTFLVKIFTLKDIQETMRIIK